jgi:hypothetical protein
MMCHGLLVLPADAVDKGKGWEEAAEMGMPNGKMKLDNKCTYEGSVTSGSKRLERILLKPEISMEIDGRN